MTTLLDRARTALDDAYAPYSDYAVGAAIETADGSIYSGCNVENANYSNSLHAEELAIGAAVGDGHREFERLAIATGGDRVTPCGKCRQTLSEFCSDDFEIVCEHPDGATTQTLGELLPAAFMASHLEGGE